MGKFRDLSRVRWAVRSHLTRRRNPDVPAFALRSGSVDVARDKAKAAVAFRRPTKAFQDLIAQGGANMRLLNLTRDAGILEGGIPIVVGGKLVGGIGVSGVTSQQDAQIAQAGIDALSK